MATQFPPVIKPGEMGKSPMEVSYLGKTSVYIHTYIYMDKYIHTIPYHTITITITITIPYIYIYIYIYNYIL